MSQTLLDKANFDKSSKIVVQYSTVQYSTVQYSTVQYSTAKYSTVQYRAVQQSTDLVPAHAQLLLRVADEAADVGAHVGHGEPAELQHPDDGVVQVVPAASVGKSGREGPTGSKMSGKINQEALP